MFIWPDSIPPGVEWIILFFFPVSLLNPVRFPVIAVLQVILIGLLLARVIVLWLRRARPRTAVLMLMLGYPATVLVTNLVMIVWFMFGR